MDPVLVTLKTLSATTVSDALDRLGIAGQCLGIKPLVHAPLPGGGLAPLPGDSAAVRRS